MDKKEELIKIVETKFKEVGELIFNTEFDMQNPSHKKLWDEMVDNAFKLAKIVKPKHHKYMIKNRGVPENTREFYNHYHPVEDLLKFIKDPHANDDPEDQTINHKFKIDIFSRRWGHTDVYHFKRTTKGWLIGSIAGIRECNKRGEPYFFKDLEHDSINYPKGLPGYLEWLWIQAKEKGLTHDQMQNALNELAVWINSCERNTPQGVWDGY